MVAFIDPRHSKIDIAQATGRAMRKAPNKTTGYIVVSLFVERNGDQTIEQALERSDFSDVADVLNALQDQDEDFVHIVQGLQEAKGRGKIFDPRGLAEKIELLAPTIELSKLKSNIFAEIIDRIGLSWDHWFGLLTRFKEREGHCLVPRFHNEGQFKLGAWISVQRTNWRQDKLSVDRKRRLEELGFVCNTHANAWQEGFAALTAFRTREGHCSPPQRYEEEKFKLGRWVHTQRRDRIRNRLSAERKLLLDKIGFVWDPLDEAWEEGFARLRGFKKREGHCDPSPKFKENGFKLGQWVRSQRARRRSMPPEQRRQLDEFGFVWATNEDAWEQGFAALCAFKKREGHCNVANSYIESGYPLGRWVGTQRLSLDGYGNRRTLSQDRRRRLDELGFIWNKFDADWEQGFQRLKVYEERLGHCRVAPGHIEGGFRLGQWVRVQRERGSSTGHRKALSVSHRKKLNDLGFVWNPLEEAWERGFNHLKEFVKREGHSRVHRYFVEGAFPLGKWVASQRQSKETLSADCQRLLESVGFVWNPLDVAWDHAIECLKRFKEREGHCEVPIDCQVGGLRLGKWVSRQRQKEATLTQERRQKLIELGFVWDPLGTDWDEAFRLLTVFKGREGHCRVPVSHLENDFRLGRWVHAQRRNREGMSENRRQRLNDLGFVWEVRGERLLPVPKTRS